MRILNLLFFILIGIFSYGESCTFEFHNSIIDIEIEDELEDEDDLLYDLKKTQFYLEPCVPEKHLKKAMRAYAERKYRRCLEYIKHYQRELETCGANIPYQYNELTVEQKVLIYSYKAYCKKNLKSYESAQDLFSELINLMKNASYKSECLFMIYWQHASCYYFMGQKEKCKDRIKKLVHMEIGPTIRELEANNFKINRQPCFHEQELIKTDKMMINEIIATSLGKEITSLNGEFIPTFCTCVDEEESFCKEWCTRICGYSTIACAFIPSKAAQAAALWALLEFQLQCENCCTKGFGHESCCRKLKKAIKYALDQERLDEI